MIPAQLHTLGFRLFDARIARNDGLLFSPIRPSVPHATA